MTYEEYYQKLIGNELIFSGVRHIKVYSKGRPRAARDGHFYTPENTRKFEEQVKRWLEKEYVAKAVQFPVKVCITLFDPIPKSASKDDLELMNNGLLYSTIGDIDNRAKAILDAANGVIYRDDRQVNAQLVTRNYDEHGGFYLAVWRNGASRAECDLLLEKRRQWLKH